LGLPIEVERAVGNEMETLSEEGWLGRDLVEKSLRRVARRAVGVMSRAGLRGDFHEAASG